MVGLMGAGDQQPPTDEDGFAAFTRSLRHPLIADMLANAEPVTPIRGYHGTANRLWHYERMARWPERFVVLGDAVCAFNPVYGQGISTAAVAGTYAQVLGMLTRPAALFAPRVLAAAARTHPGGAGPAAIRPSASETSP